MASRLTVIISQSALRQSRIADVEESLLTELMLASGLDATLIGPLASVQVDSTDYLCLSGFAQNIALVAAMPTAEVAEHWGRLQLGGQVVQLGQAAGPPGRRIYHLPLELGTQRILALLKQLLVDKAVQTVSLALPMASKSQVATADKSAVPQRPAAEADAHRKNGREPSLASMPRGSQPVLPESEWPDLDRLVDDFDSLDL